MNIETIKTIILTVLVGISLVLTIGLWNYQPNLDYLSTRSEYVSEVDIGGTEETKKTIIEPTSIIFHRDSHYFGFKNPIERQELFENMQEWIFNDYTIANVEGTQRDKDHIEITFPTSLPIELVKSLFTLSNEEQELPSWSFRKVFITFNQMNSILQVAFLSTDGQQQVQYTVKDSSIFNYLSSLMDSETQLVEYILFDHGREPIYLPAESLNIKSRSFTVKTIDSYLMVNALFQNPSNVSPNPGEAYFTDGQRGLRILNEGRSMEYIHPIHSSDERMDPLFLLDRSLSDINEHKGWTNNFVLMDMDVIYNKVRYRMVYEGYPVYSIAANGELSVIEQQYMNQDMHLYRRPLFRLENLLGGDTVKLPSGHEITYFLTNNDTFDLTQISDIQVGYKLTYLESTSHSIILDPTWYMKYRGNWLEIRIEDDSLKGVS